MQQDYAVFRFNGAVQTLNEPQFKQACRDGRLCKCGRCLACRAVEYARETGWEKKNAGVTPGACPR